MIASLTAPVRIAALACAVSIVLPMAALAAGGGDSSPPKSTNTTKTCAKGQVWDEGSQSCVKVQGNLLDDATRLGAVRELAHAGRLEDAQAMLASVTDQQDDLVLTYWGFTHRKHGNFDAAMIFYARALAQNPDNLLARSYLGQAHVEAGQFELARAELTEIRRRGGRGNWPELSLRLAIEQGRGFNY